MTLQPRAVDADHLLDLILENAPLGITLLTPDLRYVLVSRSAAETLPLTAEEAVGRHCYDIVGMHRDHPTKEGLERACDSCPALRALATGRPVTDTRYMGPDRVIRNTSVPLREPDGQVVGIMELLENIADRILDPLTGAHNYRYFDEMLEQEGYRATRYDSPLSLLALDLNEFKSVNDRFGHVRGDEILAEVAAAMRAAVRESDHLCGIGGDEFAIIAPHTTTTEATALGIRVQTAVAAAFGDLGVSTAVGTASYPRDTSDPKHLRDIADGRLYHIKESAASRRAALPSDLAE
jgi:diguanylate cyclase (GGDEF)-like protein/PAS domain S-box-containing protein